MDCNLRYYFLLIDRIHVYKNIQSIEQLVRLFCFFGSLNFSLSSSSRTKRKKMFLNHQQQRPCLCSAERETWVMCNPNIIIPLKLLTVYCFKEDDGQKENKEKKKMRSSCHLQENNKRSRPRKYTSSADTSTKTCLFSLQNEYFFFLKKIK